VRAPVVGVTARSRRLAPQWRSLSPPRPGLGAALGVPQSFTGRNVDLAAYMDDRRAVNLRYVSENCSATTLNVADSRSYCLLASGCWRDVAPGSGYRSTSESASAARLWRSA
jgi:hypothetical protein